MQTHIYACACAHMHVQTYAHWPWLRLRRWSCKKRMQSVWVFNLKPSDLFPEDHIYYRVNVTACTSHCSFKFILLLHAYLKWIGRILVHERWRNEEIPHKVSIFTPQYFDYFGGLYVLRCFVGGGCDHIIPSPFTLFKSHHQEFLITSFERPYNITYNGHVVMYPLCRVKHVNTLLCKHGCQEHLCGWWQWFPMSHMGCLWKPSV